MSRPNRIGMRQRFMVEVYGYESVVFASETPGQARYAAFRKFREAYPCTFRDFLGRSKVSPEPTR
jgi:hypothetical protein